MTTNRIPPLALTAVIGVGMWLLARSLPAGVVSLPGRSVLASLLLLAGVLVIVLALQAFRRSRTTVDPLRPERASVLVRTGIFRVTRNPMYLGMLLLLVALAAWLAHWPAALAGPSLFVVLINRWQIEPEEAALHKLFGEAFADYQRSVRRWL